MGLFQNRKKNLSPHKIHPDVLHWKKGDGLFCASVIKAIGSKNLTDVDVKKYANTGASFYYKSIDQEGFIYVEDENEDLHKFEFWRFIKCSRNESLKNRKLEKSVQESSGYMELIDHFQQAFQELQEADEKRKLLPNQKDN